jgi:tetratricopeptide (TPR) repeat protein
VAASAAALLVALISLGLATARLTATNLLLTAANRREQEARVSAQTNYQLAREAVDNYLTKVSDNPRLKVGGLRSLRKELLEEAGKFYQRFLEERTDDAALEADRGTAHYKIGQIAREIGSIQEAINHLQQAVGIFSRLTEADPGVPQYQMQLCQSHLGLAHCYLDIADFNKAEEEYQAAIPTLKSLCDSYPNVPDYGRELARAHANLANQYFHRNRRKDAEDESLQAIQIARRFAVRFPGDEFQRALGIQLLNLGTFYNRWNRLSEAESTLLQALPIVEQLKDARPEDPEPLQVLGRLHNNLSSIYQKADKITEFERETFLALALKKRLAGAHPDVPEYQADLARSYTNSAVAYHKQGKNNEAREALEIGISVLKKLTEAYPSILEYRWDLSGNQLTFGEFLVNTGKKAEAEQAFLASLQSYRDAANSDKSVPVMYPRRPMVCALHLAEIGSHARATTEAEALLGRQPEGENIYTAALVYSQSLTSARQDPNLSRADQDRLADKYAVRAIELLGQARTAGFFKSSAGLERLKKDKALNGLRSRLDFQKLLIE